MFLGPHKMKMSHYFSVFDTLWNSGLFLISEDPPTPVILNFSQLKLGTFFLFLEDSPLFGPIPNFPRFFNWKASLRFYVQKGFCQTSVASKIRREGEGPA